jgi:hypothetical protein
MEQRIRGHFSEAQCLVVILEKPAAFVVKMAKISPLSDLHQLPQPNSPENEFSLPLPPDQAAGPPNTFFCHSLTICLVAAAQGRAGLRCGAGIAWQGGGGAGRGASSSDWRESASCLLETALNAFTPMHCALYAYMVWP